jgi:hypothetical protein
MLPAAEPGKFEKSPILPGRYPIVMHTEARALLDCSGDYNVASFVHGRCVEVIAR